MIGRVEKTSGGLCDQEGGGIIRGRLRVIGRVEESSGGRLCVIGSVEESSGGVCV